MIKKEENNFIYGKNPVMEALLKNPKRINKIYIQKDIFYDNRLKKIVNMAYENKIIVKKASLQKVIENCEQLSKASVNFQGVIASMSPVEYVELDDFLKKEKEGFSKLVILDNVSDPNNFGAIIRTAAAAGFDGIIVSNHRAAPITASVEKISSGAINYIPVIKTSSLSNAIDILKKRDYWVIATEMEAKDNYYEIDYTDMNFAIVMGSEGKGITKTILNKADFTVKIESNFESLNVSTAAGIIMYEAVRQIRTKK